MVDVGGRDAVACYHPISAYKSRRGGSVSLWHEKVPDSLPLRLPCGGCVGCRTAQAKAWAFRCQLELEQHDRAAFTTLTYCDEKLPPTLRRRDLQLFVKRARKALGKSRRLRFFACGEYGETSERPHYHAILYGVDDRDRDLIADTWAAGRTQTVNVTPAAIAYTAGYCAKKIGWRVQSAGERVDYATGEVYQWQPPFIQMSRRPGIGASARRFVSSWRSFAVQNGHRMPVPRYLHEAWKAQASPEDIELLDYEKSLLAAGRDTSVERLAAGEQIAVARQGLQGSRRHL